MIYVAIVVATFSMADLAGALFCAMTDRIPMAFILMANGFVFGCLVTGRAFG